MKLKGVKVFQEIILKENFKEPRKEEWQKKQF